MLLRIRDIRHLVWLVHFLLALLLFLLSLSLPLRLQQEVLIVFDWV